MAGVRCDLCSNGPCRADASKDKRGVCGITADGMAMRMMLLRNVMGASTYHYHTDQTIKTLRATTKGRTSFEIKERVKLKEFAERFGINTSGSEKKIAMRLCDFVEADFRRKHYEPSQIVEALARALPNGHEPFLGFAMVQLAQNPKWQKKAKAVGAKGLRVIANLGGTLDLLLKAIKNGTLRGVAGLVSCTTLRDYGHDVHCVRVAQELIKRDILVLSMGCGNAAMQVAGLCALEAKESAGPGLKSLYEKLGIPPVLSYGTCTDTERLADLLATISNALGVPVPDLPVVAVAPEYMTQKATINVVFALAFGLYTYVNPVPTVTGAPNLVKLLTQDCKHVTGGVLNVEKDPVKAVDAILVHIKEKRNKIGI